MQHEEASGKTRKKSLTFCLWTGSKRNTVNTATGMENADMEKIMVPVKDTDTADTDTVRFTASCTA